MNHWRSLLASPNIHSCPLPSKAWGCWNSTCCPLFSNEAMLMKLDWCTIMLMKPWSAIMLMISRCALALARWLEVCLAGLLVLQHLSPSSSEKCLSWLVRAGLVTAAFFSRQHWRAPYVVLFSRQVYRSLTGVTRLGVMGSGQSLAQLGSGQLGSGAHAASLIISCLLASWRRRCPPPEIMQADRSVTLGHIAISITV